MDSQASKLLIIINKLNAIEKKMAINANQTKLAKRVFVESPYSGDREKNIKYAIRCMQDCLLRGEAPFLSHLLYTQDENGFVSDDDSDRQLIGREAAISASHSWRTVSDLTVFYVDLGWSKGMLAAKEYCEINKYPFCIRSI